MIDILLVGLSLGCVYGFVAVGFTLIYRTTGVMNFSQGAFVMLGGMGAGYVSEEWGLPLPLAALVGILAAGLGGLLLASGLVLPLWRRGASDFIVILSTLLFLLAVQNIVLNVILIPEYSYLGSGWATVVTELIVLAVLVYGVARIPGVLPFPMVAIAKCAVAWRVRVVRGVRGLS